MNQKNDLNSFILFKKILV